MIKRIVVKFMIFHENTIADSMDFIFNGTFYHTVLLRNAAFHGKTTELWGVVTWVISHLLPSRT